MEIRININKELPEDTVEFSIKEMTPELSKIICNLQNLSFKLIASKDEKKYQLKFDEVVTIYSENKKIVVLTESKQVYFLKGTLKDIRKKLPADFLQISSSEIINSNKISYFEFTFAGKVKIYFENNNFTYSSRSYLKEFRRFFGL